MQRVEAAIRDGRCVLAVGGRTLQRPEVVQELRRRQAMSPIALGGETISGLTSLSAESLAPALDAQGGIVVLVEPEGCLSTAYDRAGVPGRSNRISQSLGVIDVYQRVWV